VDSPHNEPVPSAIAEQAPRLHRRPVQNAINADPAPAGRKAHCHEPPTRCLAVGRQKSSMCCLETVVSITGILRQLEHLRARTRGGEDLSLTPSPAIQRQCASFAQEDQASAGCSRRRPRPTGHFRRGTLQPSSKNEGASASYPACPPMAHQLRNLFYFRHIVDVPGRSISSGTKTPHPTPSRQTAAAHRPSDLTESAG
jgi:hypothetical protein